MDLRAVFGLPADAVVTPGPRGALGRIWRVDAGPARYALKEIFGAPPSPATIDAELTFARAGHVVVRAARPATARRARADRGAHPECRGRRFESC